MWKCLRISLGKQYFFILWTSNRVHLYRKTSLLNTNDVKMFIFKWKLTFQHPWRQNANIFEEEEEEKKNMACQYAWCLNVYVFWTDPIVSVIMTSKCVHFWKENCTFPYAWKIKMIQNHKKSLDSIIFYWFHWISFDFTGFHKFLRMLPWQCEWALTNIKFSVCFFGGQPRKLIKPIYIYIYIYIYKQMYNKYIFRKDNMYV